MVYKNYSYLLQIQGWIRIILKFMIAKTESFNFCNKLITWQSKKWFFGEIKKHDKQHSPTSQAIIQLFWMKGSLELSTFNFVFGFHISKRSFETKKIYIFIWQRCNDSCQINRLRSFVLRLSRIFQSRYSILLIGGWKWWTLNFSIDLKHIISNVG